MPKIILTVKASKRIEELMTKFKPEFGNEVHIQIAKDYAQLCRDISEVKKERARRAELRQVSKAISKKQEELQVKEKWLFEKLSTVSTGY